ncbi:glycosyltransferase family 4 protein [Bacillus swezeyi]|uniref:Glycosyltransferase family 1 protein n=1 Tax=Bacillus swezeyi TaxID=1925020 RepID=A0A5M8RVU2_9BACI|nr:glycosyltransferase family 4 protein [Bacillus swezeyi]KAA6451861.1 glycosyltransferase family 1 protein [Bacillus swezeyi]TYS36084.1 glycosyltransferase family 4 protein [Bacillus swezeyi]
MKILLATYWNIPHVGGVWTYMVQLKEKLESLGHEVDLLGYGEDNRIVHIVNENRIVEKEQLLPFIDSIVDEERFPDLFKNELVSFTEVQRYVYELAALYFGLEKYDLIHAQDVISCGCLKRVLPKHTALVATLHGSVAYEIRHQLERIHRASNSDIARAYFDHLEQVGAQSGDATIVANNWLKNVLTNEFSVSDEQITIHHYGYDIDHFLNRMKTKSDDIPQTDKKIILFAGRLIENKGVHYLLSALAQLKEIRHDWECWIVGEGDKMAGLRIQCDQLGLNDDVIFMKNRDDVPYLMSLADLFVLPSLLENQPLAVIEAQIAGVPVIVSDAGGLPEIVNHEVTGLVAAKGDVNAISSYMNQLLEDDGLRKTLGSNAREFALEYWDMDEAVRNVLGVYQNIINKKGDM